MIVNPRAPRNIKYPSHIAVVIPLDAIIPAVVLSLVIGIAAIIDQMIAIYQVPAGGESQIDAISILLGGVVHYCVIAGVVCQIKAFLIVTEVVVFQEVVIAVIGKINSLGIVHGLVSDEMVVPGAVQIYASIIVAAGIVVCYQIQVAGFG